MKYAPPPAIEVSFAFTQVIKLKIGKILPTGIQYCLHAYLLKHAFLQSCYIIITNNLRIRMHGLYNLIISTSTVNYVERCIDVVLTSMNLPSTIKFNKDEISRDKTFNLRAHRIPLLYF